jgi:hypothetical protein
MICPVIRSFAWTVHVTPLTYKYSMSSAIFPLYVSISTFQ